MGAFTGIHKILDLAGHRKKVTSIDFSPDCNKVVTASEDGTVRIWNIAVRYKQNEDAKLLLTAGAPDAKKVVTHLSWGRGGYIAAACGSDLHILDSNTGTVQHTVFEAHQGRITDLAWSPAKHAGPQGSITLLASSSEDSTVRLWRGPW
jgi:WD40 repeat protein